MTWDPAAAKTATKTCVAFGMTLAIALYLDWLVTPALITAQMLQAALLGIAVRNSVTRFFGACFAGFIALVILGVAPQDRFAVVLMYSVVSAFAVYRFQGSKNPYFWLIVAFGFPFIGMATGGNPNATFMQAVHISSSFMLGGICVIIVNELLWPNPMTGLFEGGLQKALQSIQKRFSLRRAALLDGDTSHTEELQKLQGEELGLAGKLPVLLPNAAAESRQIRRFRGSYERLIDNVVVTGAELIALDDALDACMGSPMLRDRLASSASFREGLDRFEGALQALAEQAKADRDGSVAVEGAPPPDLTADVDAGTLDDLDRALIAALGSKADEAWSAILETRRDLANAENPHSPPVEAIAPARKEPFRLGALLTSFRFRWSVIAGLVSFASVYLWLLTQWPGGLRFSIFPPVFACMMVHMWPKQPLAMVAGLVLSTVLTWICFFLVLPTLPNDFLFLWPVMMLFLFPLVYLQATKTPFWALAGFVGGFCYCMLVDIEHFQRFNFSSYMTSLTGITGALAVTASAYTLIQRTPPERSFGRRVSHFFGVCERTIGEYEDEIRSPDALGRLRTRRREAVAAYQACAGLVNRLPYQGVPQNDKGKVGGLLASMWTTIVRLDVLLRERAKLAAAGLADDRGLEMRGTITDVLVEVKHAALAEPPRGDREPAPDLTTLEEPLAQVAREITGSSQSAGMVLASVGAHDALLAAVEGNRRCIRALDWQAWSIERF
jgi:hypothetical protein